MLVLLSQDSLDEYPPLTNFFPGFYLSSETRYYAKGDVPHF